MIAEANRRSLNIGPYHLAMLRNAKRAAFGHRHA
jgi:hypothetical protein